MLQYLVGFIRGILRLSCTHSQSLTNYALTVDLLTTLLVRGNKLRDAMIVSSLDVKPAKTAIRFSHFHHLCISNCIKFDYS